MKIPAVVAKEREVIPAVVLEVNQERDLGVGQEAVQEASLVIVLVPKVDQDREHLKIIVVATREQTSLSFLNYIAKISAACTNSNENIF